ncbi:TIM barrel protein [bacterium]|nr:TIM barrel protein [bacterium]
MEAMRAVNVTSRRRFLGAVAALGAAVAPVGLFAREGFKPSLAGEVGITTSSLSGHLVARPQKPGEFTLLELPKILRDELDMRVIDLNTSTLGRFDKEWLDQVRAAVDAAGCVLTNLKMNQSGLDMNSPDAAVRERALTEYRRSIDAAAQLGIPYVRPLPLKERPDMAIHVASYRALADYGADRGVKLLVENYGWMESDPQSVPKLIAAIDRDVSATPDTGNWASDEVRFAGLKAAFPYAVSCDFKARTASILCTI